MCSFSKEGEQEDGSLCGFVFANSEVGEEQSFASSMSDIAIFHQLQATSLRAATLHSEMHLCSRWPERGETT